MQPQKARACRPGDWRRARFASLGRPNLASQECAARQDESSGNRRFQPHDSGRIHKAFIGIVIRTAALYQPHQKQACLERGAAIGAYAQMEGSGKTPRWPEMAQRVASELVLVPCHAFLASASEESAIAGSNSFASTSCAR
jgi:hypothetical protein